MTFVTVLLISFSHQKHFDKLARTTFKKNFFYLIKKILCNFYYPKPIFTRPGRGLRLVVFGIGWFIQKSHFYHTCKPSVVTTRPFSLPYSSENGRVVTIDHCGLKYPNVGDSILPRRSGPASGRFPEFCHLCRRLLHKTGGLAGM
jgi:hypothetical protein